MRIRTITCHHVYNHGAYLQAYALIQYLQSLGHDAKIIDYRPQYLSGHFDLWTVPSNYKKRGLSIPYLIAKLPGRIKALKRKKAFDVFYHQYVDVESPRYNSLAELQANPPKADLYIAGSDQIWNTKFNNGRDAAFYLDFGCKQTRRISYAASFATAKIEHGYENFVKNELSNLDAISVRESSGLDILKSLGHEGVQVVDPVFLLNKNKWCDFASTEGANENYILVYDFLGSSEIRSVAERMAKTYGAKIYSVGPYKLDYTDKDFINYGPQTFVSLIKNAKCVVSNSFHGTAFSMIFAKDFFVVNRADGLNTRMQNLLSHFQISDRLINVDVADSVLMANIDYEKVGKILAKDVEESKSFLINQISHV